MPIQIRPMRAEDVETCGRICYEAFKGISENHNFRPDFPTAQAGIDLMRMLFESPNSFSVVAEQDGVVIGSNHLVEYDAIRAVGPITVDPAAQAKGAGRMLMEAVIERGKGSAGIRLVQDAFNTASLSLYASLGFDVKEPLALMEGQLKGDLPADVNVRAIEENDQPISFLLPTRQTNLFRLFLKKDLRVIKPLTLMAMGEYHEPRRCYLPSVGY